VGAHKVDAIAEALLRIDPELKINARRMRMDGQEASAGAAGLDNQLGDCDLIVDATASPTGFNRVANVAAASGTPLA
jgi:tRNA A37 threonylcarbamoyladenosine dehydratase